MKSSTLLTIALAFVCCLLSANSIKAQAVSGYTSIDYFEATNTVDAYSETDADFDLQGDYDAKVIMEIMDQNNNIINNHVYSKQSNAGLASVDVQFSGNPNYTYTAIGGHWAVANFSDHYDFYPYETFWYDDFYLSYFSVTFFVQVPTSLRRDSLSDIIEISNGDVVDGLGVLRLSGQCGAYRNVVYQLMDQETQPQPITAALEVDETFSNYQGPTNLNPGLIKTGETRYDGKLADVIGVVDSSPHCPGALTLSFNQGFVALIGTRSYILATTSSVGISYDLADWVINVNMTHP